MWLNLINIYHITSTKSLLNLNNIKKRNTKSRNLFSHWACGGLENILNKTMIKKMIEEEVENFQSIKIKQQKTI